jgi:hypothetical protein
MAAWKADYRPGHPDPDAPAFITQRGLPLDYIQTLRVIQRTAARAGIKKRIHPHLFRTSRITHLVSQNYQESVIKKSMWNNINTAQFKAYVALSEKDIDAEFLDKAGIIKKAEQPGAAVRPQPCPHCHRTNAPTADYCNRCATPLTEEAIAREEDKRTTLIADIERDPLFIALESRYQKFLEEARAEIARLKS